MGSVAAPARADVDWASRVLSNSHVATAIAVLLLAILTISLRPFQPVGPELDGGGDIVNQLGFGAAGALSICSLLMLTDRRLVFALLSPWWLLLFCFLGMAILNTPSPGDTLRSAAFSLIGIAAVSAVLVLPRDADAFSRVLVWVGLLVIGLCYVGLVAMPAVAIHQPGEAEAQHAGLWRGLFTHKNIAGPVMANLSFAGIYLWRRGWRTVGLAMFVLAMIFVFNTGSKTASATVALAAFLVAVPGLFGLRRLSVALILLSLVIMAVATLGIVFIDPVKHLASVLAPDLTYTGRTSLWEFAGEMIARRPWTGYGYENFWMTGTVENTLHPFDREWDVRGAIHSHNGYLDLAIAFGLPGLTVAVVTLILVPLRDYLRVPLYRENVLLADLFMMIVAFSLFNAFLESFFFRRADPVWMYLAMAVLGLRLVARFRVHTSVTR
jgi:O-antigen ligase